MRRRLGRIHRAVATAAACLLLAPAAHATFPGIDDRIVFESTRDFDSEIYSMNADGSNQVRLTTFPGENTDPAVSPDGRRIAFTHIVAPSNHEIYVMNADGSGIRRLTSHPANDHEPTWSPDGRRIGFTSSRDGSDNDEIYVMNADGTGQTRLTSNSSDDTSPEFSPDGSRIVFVSLRDGNLEIYAMRPGLLARRRPDRLRERSRRRRL